MIAGDEFDLGVLGGYNFAHALGPDRAVHRANALHFEHEIVLRQSRTLRFQPSESLGCADFLHVDVLEQGLKMLVPLTGVVLTKRSHGLRALGIDIAKQSVLDLVADERAEER